MAWTVCRYMFVFVGLSCISVNVSVPSDNSIHICKQPYGRKMCESLCRSVRGCSNIDYSYASRSCHVTSGPTSTGSDDVGRRATSEGLQPMRKSCSQHSRILTTRKGHSVCVRDRKTDVHRFQMTGPGLYHLGDYGIEVIERTSLLVRLNAYGKVKFTFWDGNKYGTRITIGQNKTTVIIHAVFKPNRSSDEAHSVKLAEPLWKACGFTELWFRWNNAGYMSLGKGWIIGRNLVIQYQSKLKVSFSSMTFKRTGTFRNVKRTKYNEVIIVEVKSDGHRSTIGKCSNDKTRVKFKMTTVGLDYYLSDYGFPTIGRSSVVITFNYPQNIIFRFSQEYNLPDADARMVTIICYYKGQVETCRAGIIFCVGPFMSDIDCIMKEKANGHLYKRAVYNNEKFIIWLKWDQTGYLSIGTGMTPGENRGVSYHGTSTLLVNYITMKYRKLNDPVNATFTACNKHINAEKENNAYTLSGNYSN